MKRTIDYFLLQWKQSQFRKPLLLRGARQVGKTFAIRNLGATYDNFVEVNFETQRQLRNLFEVDLLPERIINQLSMMLHQPIIPGKTLLFFDEIQAAPAGITALRYFYEMMPELHVIAAGSLLDFAIEQVGVPVGRVEFLYMYPMSFVEYLVAVGEQRYVQAFLSHDIGTPFFQIGHEYLLRQLGHYLALGGMPEVIDKWVRTKMSFESYKTHASILLGYRQDFEKYARTAQIKYVAKVFDAIPEQLGRKFKYSGIEGDYRKRELAPALDLLITAGVAYKVYYAAGQGIPVRAQIDPLDYKVIFIDVGLAQANLGIDLSGWFADIEEEFVNKGSLVEAFVGQEITAYSSPILPQELCYWHKDSTPHQAEIDYLLQVDRKVVPVAVPVEAARQKKSDALEKVRLIQDQCFVEPGKRSREVKSGSGRTLRSLQNFLLTHLQSPYGIKFSTNNYSQFEKIHAYPLYAIAQVMIADRPDMKQAIEQLLL